MLNRLGKALKQASQARFLRPFRGKYSMFLSFLKSVIGKVVLLGNRNSLIIND